MSHQAESSESKGSKKEVSTEILERKESPNRLIVDEAVINDNSVVTLQPATMEKLRLSRGDLILIKGKERKDTVCIAVGDETCEESKIRMNEVIRSNLRVGLGDVVCVHHCPDIKIGKRVDIVPLDGTVQGVTGDLFDTHLKPYFIECYRPVREGDHFFVRGRDGMPSVEFKVMKTDPAEYCVVGADTEFFYDHVGAVMKQMAQLFNSIRGNFFCLGPRFR